MSQFEFIAVLLSIIFGLGLTNLLSGMLRAFFKRELTDTRFAWSPTCYWWIGGFSSAGVTTPFGTTTNFSTCCYGVRSTI